MPQRKAASHSLVAIGWHSQNPGRLTKVGERTFLPHFGEGTPVADIRTCENGVEITFEGGDKAKVLFTPMTLYFAAAGGASDAKETERQETD